MKRLALLAAWVGMAGACNGPGAARVPIDPTSTVWVATLPPLVNAGADRQILAGTTVCLDGSSSYHPQGITYYVQWEQSAGTPVQLSDTTSRTPCFVAPLQEQTLIFSITGNDGSWTTNDSVTLYVQQNPNAMAPTVRAGPDRFIGSNETLNPNTTDVSYADPNTVIAWEAVQVGAAPGSSGILANASIFRLVGSNVTNQLKALPDYLLLWPYDSNLGSRTAPTSQLIASNANSPGAPLSLDASHSTDAFGDALHWHWTQTCGDPVLPDVGNQPQASLTLPRQPQTVCLRVSVRDSLLESTPTEVRIKVIGTDEPMASPPPLLQVHPNNVVSLNADPNAQAPSGSQFIWTQTVGTEVQLQPPVGPLTRFTAPATLEELAFTVYGSTTTLDGPLAVSVVTVEDPNVNTAPIVTLCASSVTPAAGSTVTLYASAADPEQDPLSTLISWGDAPENTVTFASSTTTPASWPSACGAVPTLQGVPATQYSTTFVAPASGTHVTLTVTACDVLNACGAASVAVAVP